MSELNVRERAKQILGNANFQVCLGEGKLISILEDIKTNGNDEEIVAKTLDNIENYLITKSKMIIQNNDYEYLKRIATALREQKVRIEESEPFCSPTFKVQIDEENKDKNFSFITREGAENFVDANSTMLRHLPSKEKTTEESEERRKIKLFDIESNKNLEIERILEIIIRNF